MFKILPADMVVGTTVDDSCRLRNGNVEGNRYREAEGDAGTTSTPLTTQRRTRRRRLNAPARCRHHVVNRQPFLRCGVTVKMIWMAVLCCLFHCLSGLSLCETHAWEIGKKRARHSPTPNRNTVATRVVNENFIRRGCRLLPTPYHSSSFQSHHPASLIDTSIPATSSQEKETGPLSIDRCKRAILLAVVVTACLCSDPSNAVTTPTIRYGEVEHSVGAREINMGIFPVNTNLISASDMERQLMQSLKAPTADRPQIPLPSVPILSTTTESNSNRKSNSSTDKTPKDNDREIIQALVSIDYSGGQQRRPLGNDLLVVKVWTGVPLSISSSSQSASTNDNSPLLLLGGAKIPMAKVGSLPIRIMLGTQNAVPSSSTSTQQRIELWKTHTTGEDLWLQAGICRSTSSNDNDDENDANFLGNMNGKGAKQSKQSSFWSSSSSDFCPEDDYELSFEGTSVSKWITLPALEEMNTPFTNVDARQTGAAMRSHSAAPSAGIRAPAAIVLRSVGGQ